MKTRGWLLKEQSDTMFALQSSHNSKLPKLPDIFWAEYKKGVELMRSFVPELEKKDNAFFHKTALSTAAFNTISPTSPIFLPIQAIQMMLAAWVANALKVANRYYLNICLGSYSNLQKLALLVSSLTKQSEKPTLLLPLTLCPQIQTTCAPNV